jgi:hypothetical protein
MRCTPADTIVVILIIILVVILALIVREHVTAAAAVAMAAAAAPAMPQRAVRGGSAAVRGGSAHWTTFKTWDSLRADRPAFDEYLKDRKAILREPNLEWGAVVDAVRPAGVAAIGIANLDPDGRTLRAIAFGPSSAGESEYWLRPALLVFQYRPEGNPFPTSRDLAAAVYSQHAANVIISRYGAFMYGVQPETTILIHESKNPNLAASNLCQYVVGAHEAIRSWSRYTMDEYFAFYPRHGLFLFVYPTPEMVGDSRRVSYQGNLESRVDHALITEFVASAYGVSHGGARASHGGAGAGSSHSRMMHDYALTFTEADIVGHHPLEGRNGYTAPDEVVGGAAAARHWASYGTWEELRADKAATTAYFRDRAAVINNPNLDWEPVLAIVRPKLAEKYEYIGLANLEPDGRTLRLESLEKSETSVEADGSARVSHETGKRHDRPALFRFHTHFDGLEPFPSSTDLATSALFDSVSRFAASVLISNYGVFVHGIDWSAYKAIHGAKNWRLAALNFCHDIVAAHNGDGVAPRHIHEYLAFYPRHQLYAFAYPSSTMVGHSQYWFRTPLDRPQSEEGILVEYTTHILKYHEYLGRPEGRSEPPKYKHFLSP